MTKKDILEELKNNIQSLSHELTGVTNIEDFPSQKLETELHELLKLVHRFEFTPNESEEAPEQEVVEVKVPEEIQPDTTTEEAVAFLTAEMEDVMSVYSSIRIDEDQEDSNTELPEEEELQNTSEAEENAPVPQTSAEESVPSIADRINNSAIKDLTEVIGISEKFLFMNELFEGDSEAYKRNLSDLNSKSNGNDAFETLKQIAQQFNWDEENEYVQRFTKMVERRYL